MSKQELSEYLARTKEQLKTATDRVKALNSEVIALEHQIREAEAETLRATHGVKVICPRCLGTGYNGDDGELPPTGLTCEYCGGRGWSWAVRWTGPVTALNREEVYHLMDTISELSEY